MSGRARGRRKSRVAVNEPEKTSQPVPGAVELLHLQGYQIQLVLDPAKSLAESEREQLIRECIPVARGGFRNDGVTESDIRLHAIQVAMALYVREEASQNLVAFATTALKPDRTPPVIYLEGTVIGPQAQGRGLYDILIAVRILAGLERLTAAVDSQVLVSTRTQNPIVFRTMSTKLGLYPHVDEPTPNDVAVAAADLAVIVRDQHSDFVSPRGLEFDPPGRSLVYELAYGYVDEAGNVRGISMQGDNISWTGDQKIDGYVQDQLNFNNGDAFLMAGWCNRKRVVALLDAAIAKVSPDDRSLLARFGGGTLAELAQSD